MGPIFQSLPIWCGHVRARGGFLTPGKDICRELDARNLVNCTLMLSAFLVLTNRRLILASGAARHLPAHLPDTRQRSRATPACSSA